MKESRYAVLIGISQYQDQNLQILQCPENDVDGLNEILLSKDYGNFSETFPLKNKPSHEVLLKVEQVLEKAEKNDLVLIYYSGHGKQDRTGKLHLAAINTQVEFLKSTSIPLESIKNYIEASKTNKVILILDCCYSGLAGKAFLRGGVDDQLQLLSSGRGIYIMTGSTGIQVALEGELEKYGAFTKHIIEGIRDWKGANEDGKVTIDSLYHYVHKQMQEEGFQKPMKWDLNVEGDLVIASSGKQKELKRAEKIRIMIFDLSVKNILPDSILSKAILLISSKKEELSGDELSFDVLLDKLFQKELEVNRFIEEWYKIVSKQSPTSTCKKPPELRSEPEKLLASKQTLTSTSIQSPEEKKRQEQPVVSIKVPTYEEWLNVASKKQPSSTPKEPSKQRPKPEQARAAKYAVPSTPIQSLEPKKVAKQSNVQSDKGISPVMKGAIIPGIVIIILFIILVVIIPAFNTHSTTSSSAPDIRPSSTPVTQPSPAPFAIMRPARTNSPAEIIYEESWSKKILLNNLT